MIFLFLYFLANPIPLNSCHVVRHIILSIIYNLIIQHVEFINPRRAACYSSLSVGVLSSEYDNIMCIGSGNGQLSISYILVQKFKSRP